MSKDNYSESQLKLRQEVLKILMKKFGHENNNKAIYVCLYYVFNVFENNKI